MARINSLDLRAPTLSPSALRIVGGSLLEADGTVAGTYNLDFFLPAYAVLIDVIAFTDVVFGAATAVLKVGTYSVASGAISTAIDDDDIIESTDVTAAAALVHGESISSRFAGGEHGNMWGLVASQTSPIDQIDIVDRFIKFYIVTTAAVATTGKIYCYMVYGLPEMDADTFTAT